VNDKPVLQGKKRSVCKVHVGPGVALAFRDIHNVIVVITIINGGLGFIIEFISTGLIADDA